MPDFLMFTEGKNELLANGLPATCSFDLSTLQITAGGLEAADTFAGGYGLVTGTGYAAKTQAEPTPSAGSAAFAQMQWATGAATDWPTAVYSIVLRTSNKLICAWHLQPAGVARNLSGANTTESVAPTLSLQVACLVGLAYDPAVAVTKATSALLAMTAVDTTNLRASFTAPASGKVLVRIQCCVHGATTFPTILLGVVEGATVIRRVAPIGGLKTTAVATAMVTQEATFVVAGLSGAKVWDAAYGVETIVASTGIKYGGPDNATANDAFGAFVFEIWEA